MEVISDLHVHGRFAIACSKNITMKSLEKGALTKGIQLLGTGDFTHPKWFQEIKSYCTESDGILRSKSGFPFILQTEIALYYKDKDKGRRIHHVVLAPDLDCVKQITSELLKRGRVDYNGRPIFGFTSVEFLDLLLSISKDIELIPAHAWTSWMSILGSKSGYDSVEECFEDKSKYIHAIETGLSSDPLMNRMVSSLDKYSMVSFSDLHSDAPWRMGRETTTFDMKNITYKELLKSIRKDKIVRTMEFYPEEGKYHLDGHRNCNTVFEPNESDKIKNICPKCGKQLTIGVLNRVEKLKDRTKKEAMKITKPFDNVVPLIELVSHHLGKGVATKTVSEFYNKLIENFGNEIGILFSTDLKNIEKLTGKNFTTLLKKNRKGGMKITPGYDGVYGKIV